MKFKFLKIKNLIKLGVNKRILNSFNEIQKKKLEILKSNFVFKPFPYDRVVPTVFKYPFGNRTDRYYFDFYYSISQNADPNYIPATTYLLYLEPALNDFRFNKNIDNKALYDKILTGIKTPKTILRKIDNFFYDSNYNLIELTEQYLMELTDAFNSLILKASIESGGGINIRLFIRVNNKLVDSKNQFNLQLLSEFPDFVLQEVVLQHNFYRQFNPSSNNTLRILTYKSVKDNKVHILHCLLRIGKLGSFTDHDNLGGIVVGITPNGILNDFGCNVNGLKLTSFNNIIFRDINRVPYIEEVKTSAIIIAEQIHYGRLLAIDFTVDNNGNSLLLEVNCYGNGTCQYQMNNGSLFKEFTEEILNYCVQKGANYFLKI
jgi:hypothetical protein